MCNGDLISVKILLDAGVNPDQPGNMGYTAFDYVSEIQGELGAEIKDLLQNARIHGKFLSDETLNTEVVDGE